MCFVKICAILKMNEVYLSVFCVFFTQVLCSYNRAECSEEERLFGTISGEMITQQDL